MIDPAKLLEARAFVREEIVPHEKTVAKGRLKPTAAGPEPTEFTVDLPDDVFSRGKLTEALIANGVKTEFPKPFLSDNVQNIIVTVLVPLALIVGLWFLFWRQAQDRKSVV